MILEIVYVVSLMNIIPELCSTCNFLSLERQRSLGAINVDSNYVRSSRNITGPENGIISGVKLNKLYNTRLLGLWSMYQSAKNSVMNRYPA